ncbi:outer membrane lipoprotein carrier protein LolA [Streptomyces sp. Y1]|uniref:Outer membrane lipoprotein carrier protein LolA n=1 Tax=Streptomyces sp. Y1 TaxID=3238634 RepID=A0AB39TJK4_9ACTN
MTNDTAVAADAEGGGVPYRSRRRMLVRAGVPIAVAAAIATGIGLVPALAADSPPDLPSLTAEQVVAKALGSDAQSLSGTVSVATDLGLPTALLGAAGGLGAASGHGGGSSASADPQAKLLDLLGGDRTVRVAVDGPDRQRVELLEDSAGYTVVHNGDQAWAWESATNSAEHFTGQPGRPGEHGEHGGLPKAPAAPLAGTPTTPQEAAKQFLSASAGTTTVSVAGTARVAGHDAYQLSVKPTQSGSTLGEVRIAVAADNGVPLAVVVKTTGGSTVLDVHFTEVSFAKPDAKTFDFTAPKGAKVTEHAAGAQPKGAAKGDGAKGAEAKGDGAKGAGAEGHGSEVNRPQVIGEGWTAVVTTKLPGGAEAPQGEGKGKHQTKPFNPQTLAKSLGKPVDGGTLISTKVVNVLLTDDGRVFAGAVTLPVLQHAAGVN